MRGEMCTGGGGTAKQYKDPTFVFCCGWMLERQRFVLFIPRMRSASGFNCRDSTQSCMTKSGWCRWWQTSPFCLCCCSFGLVAIPVQMRVYLVAGALAVIVLSFLWEHSLRQIFPAAKPPSKGYMVHKQQLKGLAGQRARSKKDL